MYASSPLPENERPKILINRSIKLPDVYINEEWLRWYFNHFHPELSQGHVLDVCIDYMRPICFPFNNQFITYLYQVELAEQDKRKADESAYSFHNTMKTAVAQNSIVVLQHLKPQLRKFKVNDRKVKVWVKSSGRSNGRVIEANDRTENHYPLMRQLWGRFDFLAIYYFRTGEYQFNEITPPNLAILVGQLLDGRFFMYRNFTPDHMDQWMITDQIIRFQVADTLNEVLLKFSATDEQRVWKNEANGYPLTYDESWMEMQSLRFDSRLQWAHGEEYYKEEKFAITPWQARNFSDSWGKYKKSWMFNKRSMAEHLRYGILDHWWMGELMKECEKEAPYWITDGGKVNGRGFRRPGDPEGTKVSIPKFYKTMVDATKTVKNRRAPRLDPLKLDKPSWV